MGRKPWKSHQVWDELYINKRRFPLIHLSSCLYCYYYLIVLMLLFLLSSLLSSLLIIIVIILYHPYNTKAILVLIITNYFHGHDSIESITNLSLHYPNDVTITPNQYATPCVAWFVTQGHLKVVTWAIMVVLMLIAHCLVAITWYQINS